MQPVEKRRCLQTIELFSKACGCLPGRRSVTLWEEGSAAGGASILGRELPLAYQLFAQHAPLYLPSCPEFLGFTNDPKNSLEAENMRLAEDDLLPPGWLHFANWADDGWYFFDVPEGPAKMDLPVLHMSFHGLGDPSAAEESAPSFQVFLLDLAARFAREEQGKWTKILAELDAARVNWFPRHPPSGLER